MKFSRLFFGSGELGAQVIDTKQGHLPQNGLWRVLGEVL